jgi:hypothetical protein
MRTWDCGVPIYRREQTNSNSLDIRFRQTTRRPPGNIPYIVDNLWEWMRPDSFPCRRHSVFASPMGDPDIPSTDLYRVAMQGACKPP